MVSEACLEQGGKKVLLLGNESIARGLLEGGLDAAAAYPGTPSTEIMETLIAARMKFGHYVEWSTNEKVAAETAISAAICGLRSSVSMKGVGVNVASEPIQAFTYMGTVGGFVLVTADDPSMNSSHNEQDNRYFAREAYLPVFEPTDCSEAKEVARQALLLSEEWKQPVMLRTTTIIGHTSGPVLLGNVPVRKRLGLFPRDPKRWVNLPQNARRMRNELLDRMASIREKIEHFQFNSVTGNGSLGVIASGAAYPVVSEAIGQLGLRREIRLMKLTTPFPLPAKKLGQFLGKCEKVLVVEELEPFVEEQLAALAHRLSLRTQISGKAHVPMAGELSVGQMVRALGSFLGRKAPSPAVSPELEKRIGELVPPRPPVLCAGCLHRNVFYSMNIVEKKLGRDKMLIRPSDIGCYTLGYQPPLNAVDTNFCMGAGVGVSSGFSRFSGQKVVATIGDSTFYHSGIPPLLNAVMNDANIVVFLLDNGTTAMTGHQPHPGVGKNASGAAQQKIDIEQMVRACGVRQLDIVPAENIDALVYALEAAVGRKGVSVIIARQRCMLLCLRERKAASSKVLPARVDEKVCRGCFICINRFGCPAMRQNGRKMAIDKDACTACGACFSRSVCPHGAILKGGGPR